MGQLADEPDGVGEQHVLVGRQAQAARGGIERGEELVLGERGRAGERVQQRGFAGVGVADDGGERPVVAQASGALRLALAADDIEFLADLLDAFLHAAAVGLELGFAFAAAHADAALLAREMAPVAGQAREQMLELRQLDLELAFPRARTPGEDVENERGAVEDLARENLLQVAALRGGKLVVEDDRVHALLAAKGGKLDRLARADERGGDGVFELLDAAAEDFTSGSAGQFREFRHGIPQSARARVPRRR